MSISCIPTSTLIQLRGYEIHILQIFITLWHVNIKHNPWQIPQAWPSLNYLAKKVGKSPFTISRSIQKLRKLKLLTAFQPHKKNGQWQTNRYFVGKFLINYAVSYLKKVKKWVSNRLRISASKLSNINNELAKKDLAVDKSIKYIDFVRLL